MPFKVIPPPANDKDFQEVGQRIIELTHKTGRPVDVEGFLHAWISGIRVIIETDSDGKDIGLAYAAMGDRWLYMDRTVSILYQNVKDKAGFMSFVESIATAMGASKLIIEADEPERKLEKETVVCVREIDL